MEGHKRNKKGIEKAIVLKSFAKCYRSSKDKKIKGDKRTYDLVVVIPYT